jgi:hypothetical protein
MHSGVSASRGFGRVPYRPGFNGSHFSAGFHHGPINRGPIRNSFRRCFGCRSFIYPWGYGGYYDPWWWNSGYDDSSYDQDYENDRAVADRMNAESLDQQRMLRQEEADGDQDVYADSRAAGSSPRSPRSSHDEAQGSPIMPATVLVFRDQHKQEVQNYAIVGQTLWSFAPQHTQKIPLANLDLAATAKANDENGVTFRVPNAGEAQ